MACASGSGEAPIKRIIKSLAQEPTASVILEDMKTEGTFTTQYLHKYRIVLPEEKQTTDWLQVPQKYYKAHAGHLGMSLYTKKDGEEQAGIAPPGYAYVGDSRYGQWRDDGRGGTFWEWYGKYALFSSLFGGWYRPIYRPDFDMYSGYRNRRTPFFGRRNQFGTRGTVARRAKPNFFSRRQAKQNLQKSTFKQRVSKRVGRTRTGFRSRGGGWGK